VAYNCHTKQTLSTPQGEKALTKSVEKEPSASPPEGRSKPISFRLEKSLIARIDNVAAHLGATRSRVVSSVLTEYVRERGDKEVERIVKKEAAHAPLNIFD
jgi:predicted DNA-binding protein